MRFSPLSNKELFEMNLIPEGFYKYRVLESKDKVSKTGRDMLELKVAVIVDGNERWVYDYLLDAMMHKIYHFCEANEMMEKYDNGSLTHGDCLGKNGGFVQIVTQKDKTGQYGDKSVIKDYFLVAPEDKVKKGISMPSHVTIDASLDQEIPF